jgi:hypothetical protein
MTLSAIGKAAAILLLLAAGCSQADNAASVLEKQRVRLASDQDARCREAVDNDLPSGSLDYGVVSSVATAKDVAKSYWRTVLTHTEVPVEELLLGRPLAAEVRKGVWHVVTTHPRNAFGAQLHIQICQSNGRVLVLNRAQ